MTFITFKIKVILFTAITITWCRKDFFETHFLKTNNKIKTTAWKNKFLQKLDKIYNEIYDKIQDSIKNEEEISLCDYEMYVDLYFFLKTIPMILILFITHLFAIMFQMKNVLATVKFTKIFT